MASIEVEELRKVRLEPGDVVVLRVSDDIDAATAHACLDVLRQVFPDNRSVILQPGQDLEVVTSTNNSGAADDGPAATTP